MTVKARNTLTVTWEIVKSVATAIIILLLKGILLELKTSHDWQIRQEARMQNMEASAQMQAGAIDRRQEYEHTNDQQVSRHEKAIAVICTKIGLPLINQ